MGFGKCRALGLKCTTGAVFVKCDSIEVKESCKPISQNLMVR